MATDSSTPRRLLLVGWDSADWNLIHPLVDRGMLPTVAGLLQDGVSGDLTTLEPQLSPMLWTSIATGKHAYHHGVPGFTEVDEVTGTIVPVSAATRKCKTLWEILSERGLRSNVVSWFATQGERDLRGCMVSNSFHHLGHAPSADELPPSPPGTYWPENLRASLDDFRVHPGEITGETLRMFVPKGAEIDHDKDHRLWCLSQRLAEAFSVQAAATWLIEHRSDWDFMAVYYRALDEICHTFMPYHPPRLDGVRESDFELYKEVVTGAYRLHDLLLLRLLQLIDDDTAVVLISDHGFHHGALRPRSTPAVPAGITVWHRRQGVFLASGPGFKRDALVYGARLLDIAPTVLHWFGLPVGEDMEGRVLREAFEGAPAQGDITSIPTWETTARPPNHASVAANNPDSSRALLEQFASLGYIDEVPSDRDQAIRQTNRENDWSMARAMMDGGRPEEALPLLERVYDEIPERADFAQMLARCQMRLGMVEEAQETIDSVIGLFNDDEIAEVIRANICCDLARFEEALDHLRAARERAPQNLQVWQLLTRTYRRMGRFADSRKAAHRVLQLDPNNAPATLDLVRCELRLGNSEAALERALDAIGLQYGDPAGHLLLGVALSRLGAYERAVEAFQSSIRLNRQMLPAYRYLAMALAKLGDAEASATCLAQARFMRSERSARMKKRRQWIDTEVVPQSRARKVDRERRRAQVLAERRDLEAADSIEFVVVSGLPRSGTSLMMQMLEHGGLDIMTDGIRKADEDNQLGYYEWEEVKRLPKEPRLIEAARGKAVKVVAPLLRYLPPKHRFKIIFMRRPVAELVRSQERMLERLGRRPQAEREHLAAMQEQYVTRILKALKASDRVETLEVSFPQLIADPTDEAARIVRFLGPDYLKGDESTLVAAVRPDLYRQRGSCDWHNPESPGADKADSGNRDIGTGH